MAENYYLTIADLVVCVSNSIGTQLDKLLGIDEFKINSSDHVDIDIVLNSEINTANIAAANVISSFSIEDEKYTLFYSEEQYYFKLYDAKSDSTYSLSHHYNSKKVHISSCNSLQHLRFMLWTAYSLASLQYGAIFIHSSCIEHKNKAVLFLGESGTGKSTQSRLWTEHISVSQLINDDSPILRIIDDKLTVYGSLWSGKTPCYRKVNHAVKAIIRIKRASTNTIEKLDTLKAIAAIYPSFPPMFAYDETLADKMLEQVSQVVLRVPIYTLKCRPDAEAALVTYQEIYGKQDNNR